MNIKEIRERFTLLTEEALNAIILNADNKKYPYMKSVLKVIPAPQK